MGIPGDRDWPVKKDWDGSDDRKGETISIDLPKGLSIKPNTKEQSRAVSNTCTCGAKFTGFPDIHSDWCDLS